MALYILGDPHFSALQPWRLPLGDAFLAWFDSFKPEPRQSASLLVLGDYTDDAVNPGEVIKQLKIFTDISNRNFAHVYFMVGNHDLKLYKNKPQLSFEFVAQEGVTILREPAEVLTIEGLKILSLPHYNYRSDIPSMWDYYSDLPETVRDQHFDIVCGHFTDASATLFDHRIDIDYLNSSYVCLGHQHTRYSDHYVGSLFPCKISENISNPARAVWVFERRDGKVLKREIPLPVFGEYRTIEYPKPLPATKVPVTIWTAVGCETEKIANDYYGNIFLRGVTLSATKKTNNSAATTDDTFVMGDPVDIFNEWVKTARLPVARPVAGLVRKLLKPKPQPAAAP